MSITIESTVRTVPIRPFTTQPVPTKNSSSHTEGLSKDVLTRTSPTEKKMTLLHPTVFQQHGLNLQPVNALELVQTTNPLNITLSHAPKGLGAFLERYRQMPMAPHHEQKAIQIFDTGLNQSIHAFSKLPPEKKGQFIRSLAHLDLQNLSQFDDIKDFDKFAPKSWLKSPGIATNAEIGQALRNAAQLPKTVWSLIPQIQKQSFQMVQQLDPALRKQFNLDASKSAYANMSAWSLRDEKHNLVGLMSAMPLETFLKTVLPPLKEPGPIPKGHGFAGLSLHADQLSKQGLPNAMIDNLIHQSRAQGFTHLWMGLPKHEDASNHLKKTYAAQPVTTKHLKTFSFLSEDVSKSVLSAYNLFNQQLVHIKL
jgi:hypothetical protein